VPVQYRRSKSLGHGARLNVGKSGVSVSKRVGPLTLNSRGRGSLRLAPGLSYRFGKKSSGTAAVVVLAVAVMLVAFRAAAVLLRVAFAVTVWLARWAWFGTAYVVERIRARRAASREAENPA
jgi:hypothetical protein